MGRSATVLILTTVAAATVLARTNVVMAPAEVVDTQQTIFPSGGLLEVKDSTGLVEISGWDQPQIEIMVTKSTRKRFAPSDIERVSEGLDQVLVTAHQVGNDHVVIRTEFPSHSVLHPLGGRSSVQLKYRIHVPRETRLVVSQDSGALKVNDVRASMVLSNRLGDIELSLPETERYAIDARARFGGVNSEWCSSNRPERADDGTPPHRLQLRVGTGEITVRKAKAQTETLVD